jgi:hypothetical protein
MTRRRPQQRDPLEAAIEAALQPGRFIGAIPRLPPFEGEANCP